jgi:hypothetical protein
MSFIHRAAITITRRQPYLDWANGIDDDGPALTEELAGDRRTIYLVPESGAKPDLEGLVDEFWEAIFHEELAAWINADEHWPAPLTRELFDAWFGVELTDSVFDLTPEEPLTNTEVELADLQDALSHCAWCEIELDEGAGRVVGFALTDRERFADRAGLTLPLLVGHDRTLTGVLAPESGEDDDEDEDDDDDDAEDDLVFLACSSRCEKAIRKVVPKALRRPIRTD